MSKQKCELGITYMIHKILIAGVGSSYYTIQKWMNNYCLFNERISKVLQNVLMLPFKLD